MTRCCCRGPSQSVRHRARETSSTRRCPSGRGPATLQLAEGEHGNAGTAGRRAGAPRRAGGGVRPYRAAVLAPSACRPVRRARGPFPAVVLANNRMSGNMQVIAAKAGLKRWWPNECADGFVCHSGSPCDFSAHAEDRVCPPARCLERSRGTSTDGTGLEVLKDLLRRPRAPPRACSTIASPWHQRRQGRHRRALSIHDYLDLKVAAGLPELPARAGHAARGGQPIRPDRMGFDVVVSAPPPATWRGLERNGLTKFANSFPLDRPCAAL